MTKVHSENPTAMKKKAFIETYHSPAMKAGELFGINPVVILSQSALESGWGQSALAVRYSNFFGITAYGPNSAYWHGEAVRLGANSLMFRVYEDAENSFLDYARLIREVYPHAASLSYDPAAFARTMSQSKYISEVNGDNREAYNRTLRLLCEQIGRLLKDLSPASHSLSPS